MLLYLFSFVYVCMFIVCFFFYMQKSAYEMRISDCISDVFSSDLRSAEAAAAPRPVRHPRRSRRPPQPPASADRRRPRADGAGPADLEIGRASRRERVCQCV